MSEKPQRLTADDRLASNWAGQGVPSIFVSHSQRDAAYSRDYVNGLRAAGLDVWYDEHNLGPGAIRSEIDRQLQVREAFIIILSLDAVASPWVSREIDGALLEEVAADPPCTREFVLRLRLDEERKDGPIHSVPHS
jgi:TIR domain